MRRRAFWFWTWSVVLAAAVVVGADLLQTWRGWPGVLDQEVMAGLLGVAAGVLAILFQRRAEFVGSLRAEWASCLEAIASVRVLYLKSTPSEADYLDAYAKLSIATDGMRAVYRNTGESNAHVGYYSFATLHDIRLFLTNDFECGLLNDPAKRRQRLQQIDGLWRLFRRKFLTELETPEASKPILSRKAVDTRKHGVSLWRRIWLKKEHTKLLASEDLEL